MIEHRRSLDPWLHILILWIQVLENELTVTFGYDGSMQSSLVPHHLKLSFLHLDNLPCPHLRVFLAEWATSCPCSVLTFSTFARKSSHCAAGTSAAGVTLGAVSAQCGLYVTVPMVLSRANYMAYFVHSWIPSTGLPCCNAQQKWLTLNLVLMSSWPAWDTHYSSVFFYLLNKIMKTPLVPNKETCYQLVGMMNNLKECLALWTKTD